MAISVNTNVGALNALAAASATNKSLETSMARLASGKRINSASDDAAGMAIASRLTSEIRGTNMAIRNASDGQALIDTAEGAQEEVVNILQRMRELANQAANDTNNAQDRTNIGDELTQLKNEIDRIANTTTWAGVKLLDGSVPATGLQLQVGSNTSSYDKLTVAINSVSSGSLGIAGAAAAEVTAGDLKAGLGASTAIYNTQTGGHISLLATGVNTSVTLNFFKANGSAVAVSVLTTDVMAGGIGAAGEGRDLLAKALAIKINEANLGLTAKANGNGIDITKGSLAVDTSAAASTTVTAIDLALNTVNTQRAKLGATSNRLDSTISNLTNTVSNLEAGS
jgi:flagellin